MVKEFSYSKESPPVGVKRDLNKIKEVAEWQAKHYEKNEEKIIGVELKEYSVEAMKIFDEARHLVFEFLKKQNININDLNIKKFNVYVTESETMSGGQYQLIYDRICINKSQLIDKEILMRTFIHEIFHKLSSNGLHMAQYKQEDNEFINKIKSGYSSEYSIIESRPEFIRTREMRIFEAFNEGITDLLTILALPSEKKKDIKTSSYATEVALAIAILVNVYDGQDGFKEFIEGYFSGKMMHLRKVEKYYGKKSLSLLANIQTKAHFKHLCDDEQLFRRVCEVRNSVILFFTTKDNTEREDLRNKLGL